jgi:hypothetical protein
MSYPGPLGSAIDFKALVKIAEKGEMLYGKCTAWTVPPVWFAGERFLLFAWSPSDAI